VQRDGAEPAVTTEDSPRMLAGVQPGPGPRHELFVYVAEPADRFWGERLAYVADPEGNLVALAAPPQT
jgi:hypothetical protein